jgi:hypothetical protein
LPNLKHIPLFAALLLPFSLKASQFAASGLKPLLVQDTLPTWFQGVPFTRSVYKDQLNWKVTAGGVEHPLLNNHCHRHGE